MDETNRQLIEEQSLPARPGSPELVDYEYRRCGVADLFVAFEPLAAKRVVLVTETRKAMDFIKELADIHYAHAERLVLVWDNLNIHAISSLYKAFPRQKHGVLRTDWKSTIPRFMLLGST